jgi:2-phosphosulfolactate phosphatase
MRRVLEVLFTPAEFERLADRNLSDTTCVVFDVLRATTSILTALANGARSVIPVVEIAEALARRRQDPGVLLAGERDGVRIQADQAEGVEFDLGNSPREFTPARVRDRTVVMTTTNGTRALRACARARRTLVGGYLNLRAVADYLQRQPPQQLLLVGSGTYEEAALEDTLAAGALCDRVWRLYESGHVADSAQIARQLHLQLGPSLVASLALARNARRLLAHPELSSDVACSVQTDTVNLLAELRADGRVVPVLA